MSNPRLEGRLTLGEVAEQLKVHPATVWRWALKGVRGRKLATSMVGGRRFVLERELNAFLYSEETESPSLDRNLRADAAGNILDALGVRPAHPK